MVVPSPITPTKCNKKLIKAFGIPVIDLSRDKAIVRNLIVKACEEYGIFKVTNHGVSNDIVSRLEDEGRRFFDKPVLEKNRAGPAQPYGYGFKNIGFNGDMGALEYLLLHSTNPLAVTDKSKLIANDPIYFSCAVNEYVHSLKNLACEILDLVGEGLCLQDKSIFSNLIRHPENDSLLRINHYPQFNEVDGTRLPSSPNLIQSQNEKIGFGEHSDPQILTILRSNDVSGLQIRLSDGTWIPVPPDPTDFCVFAGDALQAMTNGRLVSVRHRAITNTTKPRMSMVFFNAPPLNYMISPLEEMVSPQRPSLYKPFTWSDYKTTTYSHRLAHSRLDLFRIHPGNNAVHTDV